MGTTGGCRGTYFIGIDVSTRAVVCAAVDEAREVVASTAIDIRGVTNCFLRHEAIKAGLVEFLSEFILDSLQVYVEAPPYVQNIRVFKQLAQVEYSVLVILYGLFTTPGHHVQSLNPIEWRKLSIGNTRAKKKDLEVWLDNEFDIRPSKGPFKQDYVDAFCMAIGGVNEFKRGVRNG